MKSTVVSHFVTDTALRSSHRTVNEAPFNASGAPWLGNYQTDVKPLSPEPNRITIPLKVSANKFDKGNRIRITIAGADAKSGVPIKRLGEGHTALTVHLSKDLPSRVKLPTIRRGVGASNVETR